MLRSLFLLALFAAPFSWGQVSAPVVTVSQVDAAIARVTATVPEDDPDRVVLLTSYADTLSALSRIEEFTEQRETYALARANAGEEANIIDAKLAQAFLSPENDDSLQGLPLPELEQVFQVEKLELDASRKELTDIRTAIDGMPVRSVQIRTKVAELSSASAELASRLNSMDGSHESGSDEEAEFWLASAELASFNAKQAALEEELLSQPMRLDLLKAKLDETSYNIERLERRSLAMTQLASGLREGEAAEAQANAALMLADAEGKHPLVRYVADRNAEITAIFSVRNEDIEVAEERVSRFSSEADQLELDLSSIEHKLELLGMSAVVGEILRERQAQLPRYKKMESLIASNSEDIRDSSLRQVELEDERRLLHNPSNYVSEQLSGLAPQVAADINDDLTDLVLRRRELVYKAIGLENTYGQALGELDFTLRRYAHATDALSDFISERLLWIPSQDKFEFFDGKETGLVKQLGDVVDGARWLSLIKGIPEELLDRPFIGALLLVVLVLVYYTPQLKLQLAETGKQVGYVRSDRFVSTLHALGLSVLLSLKWPLLLLGVAWLFELQDGEPELATALYLFLETSSFYLWGLEFLRSVFLPKGLVDAHFQRPASRVSLFRRRVVLLELTFIPTSSLVVFFLSLYPRSVGGSLGTLSVILALLSLAYFFYQLPDLFQNKMKANFNSSDSSIGPFWSRAMRKLLFWIPVAAIFAVFMGYTYTAVEIALLLIFTFVLLSCIVIAHELGMRWLALTQRRMVYEARQEHAKSDSDDDEAVLEDELRKDAPELLNDEGTKLLNFVTLLGCLLGIAWIWAEIFPALGFLDSFSLWHQTTVVDGREVSDPVTLGGILRALLIAGIGWVVVQRIPGLFEIFLRQKMEVRPASAYALTRVLQYTLTMILLIIVAGSMGVSWSSLQWAVAALSLGIGFGLQEIVANFISGLIILFEQPIRLGDTVTVGDVSGTVTRIQMRATTIRDYDRRELLVPNKEFITSRLLNWSLSDSVTRRMIEIGVAYGTDMEKALDIVRDVARKHPLVLGDPEPLITFDEFGDNSLLVCLRYYIEHLDMRLTVDSELRLQIIQRYDDAGIVIAFPQRDIHIDSAQPLEIKMLEPGQGN